MAKCESPLFWDPIAIGTYLTGSTLFLFVALIPDLAILRDRTTGIKKGIYTVLALGVEREPRQWQLQVVAGILLSALMLPIFVSVHSIVSWDFAVTPAVEGWHSTIFALLCYWCCAFWCISRSNNDVFMLWKWNKY